MTRTEVQPATAGSDAQGQAQRRRPLPILGPFFDRRPVRSVTVHDRRPGLLAGMRVRKKLVFLHTCFSGALAIVLLVTLWPALSAVVRTSEIEKSVLLLSTALTSGGLDRIDQAAPDVRVLRGGPDRIQAAPDAFAQARRTPGRAIASQTSAIGPCAVAMQSAADASADQFVALAATIPAARSEVSRLYVFLVVALLGIYLVVAIAIELFVLPQSVYLPIRRMLDADEALRQGRHDAEIIPAREIPSDELGEIMRSRNESITQLRRQETALADALNRLEEAANDLKRKNYLLEAAQRNLADADRLASLGMMSAGIAHELNTPLTVLKGMTERIRENPGAGVEPAQAALMHRVVERLERLGDSLLDYARVRAPHMRPTLVREVVQEALTLVRLDRDATDIHFANDVDASVIAACDPDRIVQVMVNLVRNAVDAIRTATATAQATRAQASGSISRAEVRITCESVRKDDRSWICITVTDDGPGIAPEVLARLFDPFVSTRLDSRGTGLGLAVAEGIVREHGGLLLARNRSDQSGAAFDVLLPVSPPGPSDATAPTVS